MLDSPGTEINVLNRNVWTINPRGPRSLAEIVKVGRWRNTGSVRLRVDI